MTQYDQLAALDTQYAAQPLRVIRHREACKKINVSSAKLFDMVARGLFPRPFPIVPGGRAMGWLEQDVDNWIRQRCANAQEAGI